MVTISIFEPRYRDMTVLVARYKIPAGNDIMVDIKKGARAGKYLVRNENICKSPIEQMKTKTGKYITMRAISLDYLERVEEC